MIADAAQRLRAAEDLLTKREVVAPEAGTVTDIKSFTPGSSITPGQPVLDIVPAERTAADRGAGRADRYRACPCRPAGEFQVVGLQGAPCPDGGRTPGLCRGRPAAGSRRAIRSSMVRAELDPGALKPFPGVMVYPGMPADLLIIGGERSAARFHDFADTRRHAARHARRINVTCQSI